MSITPERDAAAAARMQAGWAAYRAGIRFDTQKGGDWCDGWLAAALATAKDLEACRGLLEHREAIVAAMHEAYAAIRRIEGVSKLRPGDRSHLNLAAVKLGAVLPHAEQGSPKPGDARRARRT